ncbi:MAG: hypothetical protein MMC23_005937 [Stictis urceolatum]|nr:hypothetical protein [Stictis urceolata]
MSQPIWPKTGLNPTATATTSALKAVTGDNAFIVFPHCKLLDLNDVAVQDFDRPHLREWLASSGFPGNNPAVWYHIRKNWVSYLSATSCKPSIVLAPFRKVIYDVKPGETHIQIRARAFKEDRAIRLRVEEKVWTMLDSYEAFVEKWPEEARVKMMPEFQAGTKPFETLNSDEYVPYRRRLQGVWVGFVGFLVYAFEAGMLEEMGLKVDDALEDYLIGIIMDTGIEHSPIDQHLDDMLGELVSDPAWGNDMSGNPLLWWMGVLVYSSLQVTDQDYICIGKFEGSPLPLGMDIRTRLASILHYGKALMTRINIPKERLDKQQARCDEPILVSRYTAGSRNFVPMSTLAIGVPNVKIGRNKIEYLEKRCKSILTEGIAPLKTVLDLLLVNTDLMEHVCD